MGNRDSPTRTARMRVEIRQSRARLSCRWKAGLVLMPQYLKRRRLWRCNWCMAEFFTRSDIELHDCAVKSAVLLTERQAGRILTFAEVRAARDRARKEIAMAREFGR